MLDLDCPLHGTASKAYAPHTEMTSLREIKDKLDAINVRLDGLSKHEHFDSGMIAQKLDALAESQKRIEEQLLTKAAASQAHVIAESQGKLLAALNDVNGNVVWITAFLKGWQSKIDEQFAGLHETAMRNHQQVLAELKNLPDLKNVQMSPATLDLWHSVDGKLSLLIQAKPPRKPRKKARR